MDPQIPQLIGDAAEGASNVYTVAEPSVKVTALVDGGTYRIRFDEINTGAATVNVGTGDIDIVNRATSATVSGDIQADVWIDLVYDAANTHFAPVQPFASDHFQSFESFYVPAGAMISRTTNGAEAMTTEFATNDVMVDQFAFDASTEEAVQFSWRMPDDWDGGTVKAKIHWDAAATASGTAVFGVSARSYANSDAIDQAFGTEVTVTDTLLTVGDVHLSPATAAITLAGATPSVSDYQIYQIVVKTSGTIAVDVLLMGVTIQYGKTRSLITEF